MCVFVCISIHPPIQPSIGVKGVGRQSGIGITQQTAGVFFTVCLLTLSNIFLSNLSTLGGGAKEDCLQKQFYEHLLSRGDERRRGTGECTSCLPSVLMATGFQCLFSIVCLFALFQSLPLHSQMRKKIKRSDTGQCVLAAWLRDAAKFINGL